MRKLASFLCVFCLTASGWAQQQTWSWKEYVYTEDGFAVTLPNPPVPHKDALNPAITVYTVHFTADSGLSLRVDHETRDCAATLGQLKDAVLQNKHPEEPVDPSSLKDVSLNGNPGLEYEFKVGTDHKTYDRYYCVNGRLYVFSVIWPSRQPRPAAATRILNSFRFLKAESHK